LSKPHLIPAEQICIQQVRIMRRKYQLCILGIRQPLERCPTKGCPPHKPMINHWFSVDLPIEKKLIFFSNAAKILLIPTFHQRFTSVSPTFQP